MVSIHAVGEDRQVKKQLQKCVANASVICLRKYSLLFEHTEEPGKIKESLSGENDTLAET